MDSYDLSSITSILNDITSSLLQSLNPQVIEFESELDSFMQNYNKQSFPSPEFKIDIRNKRIDEKPYAQYHEDQVNQAYQTMLKKHQIKLLNQNQDTFLNKWYIHSVRQEIDFLQSLINTIANPKDRQMAQIILSRTIRSCRATTHADLATLKLPQIRPYYCKKHGKICKPLFSLKKWWQTYAKDTLKRLKTFETLRTNTNQICLTGDSRSINILSELKKIQPKFATLAKKQKIKGIFSSPPYVGLIDYHEQHAYAYELFGLDRQDELEIGPLFKGQGIEARKSYVEGISNVLNNAKQYLADDYHVFLVSNDKYNLYPEIAKRAGMQIINQFKRPVLNRTEKDKGAYAEIIFHMKEN